MLVACQKMSEWNRIFFLCYAKTKALEPKESNFNAGDASYPRWDCQSFFVQTYLIGLTAPFCWLLLLSLHSWQLRAAFSDALVGLQVLDKIFRLNSWTTKFLLSIFCSTYFLSCSHLCFHKHAYTSQNFIFWSRTLIIGRLVKKMSEWIFNRETVNGTQTPKLRSHSFKLLMS